MHAPSHPFDQHLKWIAPRTHRLTAGEITGLPTGEHLAVTLLMPTRDPAFNIHVCVYPAQGGRLRLTRPAGARDSFPIGLAGTGIAEDGTVEPSAIAASPCQCPRGAGGDGRHWNPLAFALHWYQGLDPLIAQIVSAFRANVRSTPQEYCLDGIRLVRADGV